MFVEHLVHSLFKMKSLLILFFLFEFATFNRKCVCKSHLFLKCKVLREGSSFIASIVKHPVYSKFRMYSVLILIFFSFNWLQLFQRASARVNFLKNFRCSVKGAVLLLRSWSTLYRAFSKCKLSGSWLFYFDLPLLTQRVCLKVIYSWRFRCSTKEAVLWLLSWSTL